MSFRVGLASVVRKIAGYLTKDRSGNGGKPPKAHTKTSASSRKKLFVEIQNSFLNFVVLERKGFLLLREGEKRLAA